MNEIDRRKFLACSAGVAVGLEAATQVTGATLNQPATPPAPPRVALGRTGLTTSRLAMGTGVHGSNRQSDETRLGFERLVALFKHAYDRGVTFFDMADMYGSHVYFREALRTIPRDHVTILTKMWWRFDGPAESTPAAVRKRMATIALDRFRHELATDYIDIVLLHCLTTNAWDKELAPYMEALADAKQKKQIKAVGVSCHTLGALSKVAEVPWVDVVLTRINPRGALMDDKVEEVVPVLRRIKRAGKTIVGMKIFGEGRLVKEKEECIRYAQNLGLLDAMTIGFIAPQQIDEVLTLLAKFPAAPIAAGNGNANP